MRRVAPRGAVRCGVVAGGVLLVLAGMAHAEVRPAVMLPPSEPGSVADGGPGAAPEIVPAAGVSAEVVPPRPRTQEDAATPASAGSARPADAGPDAGRPGTPIDDPYPGGRLPAEASVPVPVAPLPSGNIRWPAASPAAAGGDATGEPGTAAASIAAADAGTRGDTDAAADSGKEITPAPEDAFERALAAWRSDAGPRSQREAARWFRVAADAGDRRAAIAFAYLQGLGLGVARDQLAARRSLQQASDAGLPRADYLLSLLAAADRRPGGERQQGEFRERAARRDDAVAQNAMGVHYQLQGDRTTAEMWYRRAADNGSPAARLNLAALAEGDEARQSSAATVGAGQGETDADTLFERARRHHRGDGVPVDYGLALRLYRQAAANGSEPAQQMLGLIQSRTLPGGGFDPSWMRQLASAAVGKPGNANLGPGIAPAAQPRLDDPLHGLAELAR